MDKNTFISKLKSLGSVPNISGSNNYIVINVKDNKVFFRREDHTNHEIINLDGLFNFYIKESDYKTTVADKYVNRWVRSPAAAILNAIAKTN